jgi:hypothetical protein
MNLVVVLTEISPFCACTNPSNTATIKLYFIFNNISIKISIKLSLFALILLLCAQCLTLCPLLKEHLPQLSRHLIGLEAVHLLLSGRLSRGLSLVEGCRSIVLVADPFGHASEVMVSAQASRESRDPNNYEISFLPVNAAQAGHIMVLVHDIQVVAHLSDLSPEAVLASDILLRCCLLPHRLLSGRVRPRIQEMYSPALLS